MKIQLFNSFTMFKSLWNVLQANSLWMSSKRYLLPKASEKPVFMQVQRKLNKLKYMQGYK